MSARLASGSVNCPRRFLGIRGPIAAPRWLATVSTREPYGSFDGLVRVRTSAWACRRCVALLWMCDPPHLIGAPPLWMAMGA